MVEVPNALFDKDQRHRERPWIFPYSISKSIVLQDAGIVPCTLSCCLCNEIVLPSYGGPRQLSRRVVEGGAEASE